MTDRSPSEWLRWQESLYPRPIDLRLDRVQAVAERLGFARPEGSVFTVAGTNGKGSTVTLLEGFLRAAGRRTGVYTSPHLVTYNERIRIDGVAVGDADLVAAFERVESARGTIPLTFFEFGTLSAFSAFAARGCDAWVLEVGMGGRLDAVNVVDADYAVITTIGLDHQEYLGSTVEEIAAEKAGILRGGRPGFYGDWPVPDSVRRVAAERGAGLRCLGEHFDFTPARPGWSWRGQRLVLEGLTWTPGATTTQLRNASVALAALEQYDAGLITDVVTVNELLLRARPAGRFQLVERDRQWVLDVAHNPQAVETLRAQLETQPPAVEMTVVLGILGDKDIDAFARFLGDLAHRWICCTVEDPRARSAEAMAARLRELGMMAVTTAGSAGDAFALARRTTAPGGRILVCGSFRVVGPALRWLGIY